MNKELIENVYSQVEVALSSIYKKRKQALFFQKMMWVLTGLYLVFMVANVVVSYFPASENSFTTFFKILQPTKDNPYANLYPIIGLVVLLYPTTFIFTRAFQSLKLKENETITKMVKMLFPQVEFSQGALAPINEIKNSKLFAWVKTNSPIFNYGQIRSSDNGNIINIADIGIIEDNISNKLMSVIMRIPGLNLLAILYQFVLKNVFTRKTSDNVYYTFRGMFCWLSFKKKLNGHTVIIPNNQITKLDRLSSFKFTNEHKVTLEDPRFTNQFLVYSTDQVEARYVLSLAVMERIVNLKEKFNQPILLSFHNKQMYFAVENKNGLFSFPSGQLNTIATIDELANDIDTALRISQV